MMEAEDSSRLWLGNEGARKRVASLLNKSGVTLEAQVARQCRRITSPRSHHSGPFIDTSTLVYGNPDSDEPLREIDQVVTFYEEWEQSETVGLQLILQATIEAKHREDVQIFGVSVEGTEVGPEALPVAGSLNRSRLVRNHVASQLPGYFDGRMLRRLALIRFKEDGRTPTNVDDEQLIYKAAAGLYDYIRSVSSDDYQDRGFTHLEDILNEFDQYLNRTHYPYWTARDWVEKIPLERVKKLNAQTFGARRIHYGVIVYCPIVCVDAPMCIAEVDDNGSVIEFEETDILMTSVRVAGWPWKLSADVAVNTPQAIVTVANIAGLPGVLESLREYHAGLKANLNNVDTEIVDRAPFESDFLSAVRRKYIEASIYRSDLDMGLLDL